MLSWTWIQEWEIRISIYISVLEEIAHPLQRKTLIIKPEVRPVLFMIVLSFHLQFARIEKAIISQPVVKCHEDKGFTDS